jgi:probable HAF family extracellular repeat protein
MRYAPILVLIAAVGCGNEDPLTQPGGRPSRAVAAAVQYQVVKLPSLGVLNRGMAINSQGWVAGWAQQANGSRRAAFWRGDAYGALGTLGGPSTMVPWPGQNDAGVIVGISHTGDTDPNDEEWSCELGDFVLETTDLACRGFVYDNGTMRELPTLGGTHGFATDVNNSGLVVGWAETATPDSTCVDAQVLQFRAVVWDPKAGNGKVKVRALRPFGDDPVSAATVINDQGEVAGISGICDQAVGRFSAIRAVVWDKSGKPAEIPNLGGRTWHTPMDMNERGDVVGFSNPEGEDPEGDFIAQAFLWVRGSTIAVNLGTLDDDPLSEAFAINEEGQIVGVSFGGLLGPRAFLYENGELHDLNDLIDGDDVFLSAQDINDAGQITGRVRDAVTGETLAFIATPVAE